MQGKINKCYFCGIVLNRVANEEAQDEGIKVVRNGKDEILTLVRKQADVVAEPIQEKKK